MNKIQILILISLSPLLRKLPTVMNTVKELRSAKLPVLFLSLNVPQKDLFFGVLMSSILQPGYSLDPYITYSSQASTNGTWNFPPPGQVPYVLLGKAFVYLNITADDCQEANPVPTGRVLSTIHNFSFRPYQTYLYGEFDTLKWSAYIGMGNETNATALAGKLFSKCNLAHL